MPLSMEYSLPLTAQELAAYKESSEWLKAHFLNEALPTIKDMKAKKDALKKRKETLQGNYEYYRDYERDLRTVTTNVDEIIGVDTSRQTVNGK